MGYALLRLVAVRVSLAEITRAMRSIGARMPFNSLLARELSSGQVRVRHGDFPHSLLTTTINSSWALAGGPCVAEPFGPSPSCNKDWRVASADSSVRPAVAA